MGRLTDDAGLLSNITEKEMTKETKKKEKCKKNKAKNNQTRKNEEQREITCRALENKAGIAKLPTQDLKTCDISIL
jgi:hypothetical protein